MGRRKVGRALVLLGAALLLLGNVLWCAVHDAPTLLGVLADIRFWGLSEAFSGDHDSVAALLLLGNVLMDAYLLCVAVLALLLLRGAVRGHWASSRRTPSSSPSPSYTGERLRMSIICSWPSWLPRLSRRPRAW